MTGRTILLVEGTDDEHVIKHICGARRIGEIDKIIQYGGKDPLLEGIPVRLKESDVAAIGVVIDADTDLKARWDSVKGRVEPSGYVLPRTPNPAGTIIAPPAGSDLPRLGVWVMPDNKVPGILEDFLACLVQDDGVLLEHVKKSIDSIPPGALRFDALKRSKAEIHTWLAWQQEPGKPLGVSIMARYLDPNVPEVTVFSNWLNDLFF